MADRGFSLSANEEEIIKALVKLRIAENNYELFKQQYSENMLTNFSEYWEKIKWLQSDRDNARRRYERVVDSPKFLRDLLARLERHKITPEQYCVQYSLIPDLKL